MQNDHPNAEPDHHAHPAFSKVCSSTSCAERRPSAVAAWRTSRASPYRSTSVRPCTASFLSPDEFDKRFATLPELNLRTNSAGKAERDIFQQQNADKTIISADDMTMRTMRIGLCSSRGALCWR